MSDAVQEREPYRIFAELPTPSEFVALREANDMTARPRTAVEAGLTKSLFGVTAIHQPTDDAVGMGRILGDDAMVYQISDMAVHPDHQRRGVGTLIMDVLLEYIEDTAPENAEINLFADVDEFYTRFGFEKTSPNSKGMVKFVK